MNHSRALWGLLVLWAGCGRETPAPSSSMNPPQPKMEVRENPKALVGEMPPPSNIEKPPAPENPQAAGKERGDSRPSPLSSSDPGKSPAVPALEAPRGPSARKVYTPPPLRPSQDPPTSTTPAFTFRTMDHKLAYVIVNGERYSDTTCQWALSLSTPFDGAIQVPAWPPHGAAWVGALSGKSDQTGLISKVEIAIAGGFNDEAGQKRLKHDYPQLEPGEQILYVKASIEGKERRGALRLKLVGTDGTFYRYTNYSPLQNMEEENASKLARAVWFQPEEEQ